MEIMTGWGGKNSAVEHNGKACGTRGRFYRGREEGGWSTHLSQRQIGAFNVEKRFDSRSFLVPDEESFPIFISALCSCPDVRLLVEEIQS